MPYPEKIAYDLGKTYKRCFCCNKLFGHGEYIARHSGCALHLILVPGIAPEKYAYMVTDPPKNSNYHVGDIISVDTFPVFGFRYWADAVCVCFKCHNAIHSLALELCIAQDRTFTGNTPYPGVLAEATFNFHLYPVPPFPDLSKLLLK